MPFTERQQRSDWLYKRDGIFLKFQHDAAGGRMCDLLQCLGWNVLEQRQQQLSERGGVLIQPGYYSVDEQYQPLQVRSIR
jgi:hypothetical protein